MNAITFEQLPQAVALLFQKLDRIEEIILKTASEVSPDDTQLLTVEEAAAFLHLTVPTIYGLTSKGSLPVMKRSKRCYFSKSDLIQYIKEGRKKSITEVSAQADNYLNTKRK